MKILKLSEYISENTHKPSLEKIHANSVIYKDNSLTPIQRHILQDCVTGIRFNHAPDGSLVEVPVTHETFKILYAGTNDQIDNLLTFVDDYLDKHGFKWCYPHNEDAVNPDKREFGHRFNWTLEELNSACGI